MESDKRLNDKLWRLSNLYKIKNKQKQVVTFRLNRAQADFHKNKTNRNIILKSRQLGFSTYEAIDSLDDVLFTSNTEALMLSYDQPSQLDMFDNKVNFAWNNLHPNLKSLYTLDADRANKLKFNWGDGSSSAVTVKTHGRSGTFNRLHISEFAKICKNSHAQAEEIISGTMPAVPLKGRIDIESTAEDDSGHFYEMFWEAYEREKSGRPTTPMDFKAFFYNWTYDDDEIEQVITMDPEKLPKEFQEYQKLHNLSDREITYYYYKWISLNRSWKLLKREYPTTPEEAFEAAGDKLFDVDKLGLMVTREPFLVQGQWKYFAQYRPGHRYAAAADPSEGLGKDNATIAIIDFDAKPKPELVAIYVNDKIPPDLLAYEIRNGAVGYGNCLVAVERNNHGHATLAILKGIYYNIYKERKFDKTQDTETEKLGWSTNMATKPQMLFDFNTAVNEELVNIPDVDSVREFQTYLRDDLAQTNKDPELKHWDRVIAICICWQMKNYAIGNKIIVEDSGGDFDKFNITGSL